MAVMQTHFIPLPNIKLDLKMITSDLTIPPPQKKPVFKPEILYTNTPRAPSTQRGSSAQQGKSVQRTSVATDAWILSTSALVLLRLPGTDPFCNQLPCSGRVGPRVPGAGLHVMLGGGGDSYIVLHVSKGIHQRKDTRKEVRTVTKTVKKKRCKRSSSVPDG